MTYFFNGGREEPWEGETRILVPSPRDVPSYDHKPEMAAREVTERFCAELPEGYGVRRRQLRQPGHGRATPARSRPSCRLWKPWTNASSGLWKLWKTSAVHV